MIALLAHVGAGLGGIWSGLLHPFTGVDHLLAMVAVGLLAAVAVDRRQAWRTPAAFAAGMVGGGVLGLSGVGATAIVEPAIAVSVVALGLLLAASVVPSWRVDRALPVVAAVAGVAHGVAHGTEVPTSAHPVAYVAGFVVATVTLHLVGVALGSTVGRHPAVRSALAGTISVAGVALVVALPL